MSTERILLCFLQLLLKLSLAYADDCDRSLNDVSVIGKTSSSITMRIKLSSHCFPNKLKGLSIFYRTEPPLVVPASMTWDFSNSYYTLTPAYLFNDTGTVLLLPETSSTGVKSSKETFTISNLKAPNTNYEFRVQSYRTKEFDRLVNARTLMSDIPPNTPKTGIGLFRVENPKKLDYRGAQGHRRDVWVYFQEVYDSRTLFNLTVYEEDGDRSKFFYSSSDRLNKSFIHKEINFKRHRFVFHTYDDDHNYSEHYSEITIPAQRDILPELVTTYYEDKENDTVSVVWDTPKDVQVENYTLAWFDYRLPEVKDEPKVYSYIRDFVILDKNTNRVQLKKPNKYEKMILAMGVNTKMGSSGLHSVRAT